MVKVELSGHDELMQVLTKLGAGADPLIRKMLRQGGEIVVNATKNTLTTALSGYSPKHGMRRTGALIESVKAGAMTVSGADSSISVWPHGTRMDDNHKRGASNATIGFVNENGKRGVPPRPFMAPAAESSTPEVHALWDRMVEEFVNKG